MWANASSKVVGSGFQQDWHRIHESSLRTPLRSGQSPVRKYRISSSGLRDGAGSLLPFLAFGQVSNGVASAVRIDATPKSAPPLAATFRSLGCRCGAGARVGEAPNQILRGNHHPLTILGTGRTGFMKYRDKLAHSFFQRG